MAAKRTEKKIPDYFGEYVGGARRDEWRVAGLQVKHLEGMTDAELDKWVKRDSVWPLPNAVKAVESGLDPFVVYWARAIRRMTYSNPLCCSYSFIRLDKSEQAELYIRDMTELRSHVEAVTDMDGIEDFYKKYLPTAKLDYCVDRHEIRKSWYSLPRLRRICFNSNFPYTKRKTTRPVPSAKKHQKAPFL